MSGSMSTPGRRTRRRLDVMSGELTRTWFGAGIETPVAWLETLSVQCGRAMRRGPMGYGLYRGGGRGRDWDGVIAPGLNLQ
jgi:hypothetical protein